MKTLVLFFKKALCVILEALLKLPSCFLFLKTHTDTETRTHLFVMFTSNPNTTWLSL